MGNVLAPSGASLNDAIAEGDADAAVEVLQAHPDLIRKRLGSKKRTLYHYCASSGQVAVLKSLCDYVSKTVPDESGELARAQGANRQHSVIQQFINASDQKGLTPLSLACKKGHAQVVTFLLSQSANPWVNDRKMGRTALHHAARANHPDCIEAILSHPMVQQEGGPETSSSKLVDHPTNSGYTPLHYAAAAHSREAAAVLLRHGADPNAKIWEVGFEHIQLDRGSTPLHAAARYHSFDVAMLLLRHWDENLRQHDVTDPRVVENLLRIKPHQLPGVKLNKALLRVLDPGTPLREIRQWFGEARVPQHLGKAPVVAQQRTSAGLNCQDSELSGSGGGAAEDSSPGETGGAGAGSRTVERSSPQTVSMHRQGNAWSVHHVASAVPLGDASLEAGRGSRDSEGAGGNSVLFVDRSSRRRSIPDANPAAVSGLAAKTTSAAASPFGNFLAAASGGDHPTDRYRSSNKRSSLSTATSTNPSSTTHASSGLGGRSRSGAVFPEPTPAGISSSNSSPSPAPQLLRCRSLQASPGAGASLQVGTAFSLPRPISPSNEGRTDGRTSHDHHPPPIQPHLGSWVSCAKDLASTTSYGLAPKAPGTTTFPGGGGSAAAAYPGQMPLAAAVSSLGFPSHDGDDFAPGAHTVHPGGVRQASNGTLNVRAQPPRDGSTSYLNGLTSHGRSGGSDALWNTTTTVASGSSPLTTAWQEAPPNTSSTAQIAPAAAPPPGGAGSQLQRRSSSELRRTASAGRSLAKTLSRKLSSFASHATVAAAAVRHDSVRTCNPEQPPVRDVQGSGGASEGRSARIRPSRSSAFLLASLPGWAKPAAVGGCAAGGVMPPPAVRVAF